MKHPIKYEDYKKLTPYPYLATLAQFDDWASEQIREEMKKFGSEKYMAGFHFAIKILKSVGGSDDLVNKVIKESKL